MRKWFVLGAIFLSSYSVFLVATLPVNLVINAVNLPKNVFVVGASGTIWQGTIEQLTVSNNTISKIKYQLNFLPLLMLKANVAVEFGDPLMAGAEGEFNVDVSQNNLKITEANVFVSSNEIARQLPLPIPVSAKGNVNLTLENLEIALPFSNKCIAVSGNVLWPKAGVVALEQKVALGDLRATLSCEKELFTASINPKNNLGLIFRAHLTEKGKTLGQGYLKPDKDFPVELKGALSFLGPQDSKKRYPLKF